jgi:RNA polymerase sigma factor (sigma-70 family)
MIEVNSDDTIDFELVQRLRDGEQHACEELLARHQAALRAFIRMRGPLEVDELAQRTIVAFLEAKDRFRQDASVRTFLIAIANRQIQVDRRRNARDFSDLKLLAEQPALPLTQLISQEAESRLAQSLAQLPAELRQVIELYYWHDLSTTQIADRLSLALGTVASRLRRAKQQLRRMFE